MQEADKPEFSKLKSRVQEPDKSWITYFQENKMNEKQVPIIFTITTEINKWREFKYLMLLF